MTEPDIDPADSELRSALRSGIAARDRAQRTPPFSRVWPREVEATRSRPLSWGPAFVATVLLAVIVAGVWRWPDHHSAPLDASLAHQLSSDEFWHVPTDAILAYEAPRLSADLPSPDSFQVSLEESYL